MLLTVRREGSRLPFRWAADQQRVTDDTPLDFLAGRSFRHSDSFRK